MIQRIQTIYLLFAVSLMTAFSFSPLASFSTSSDIYSLSVLGIKSADGITIYSTPYLIIVAALATLLPLVNIFLFKKRMVQIRLCVAQLVLMLGTLIIAGIYYYLSNRIFGGEGSELINYSIRIVCVLPVVAMISSYMALRAIFKDEMLIKSLDRIR